MSDSPNAGTQRKPQRNTAMRPRYRGIALAAALLLVAWIACLLLEHHAGPIARRRIVSSLEAKYHTTVELDQVTVSVLHGLQVDGRGLRIMAIANRERLKPGGPPMLMAREFQFATTLGDLVFHHESAVTAYAQGLVISIPAANDVKPIPQTDPEKAGRPRDSLFLNRIIATDSTLVLESSDPARPPITFDFNKLILFDPGKNQPFTYETILTNPAPRGEIHSTGHIGPWNHNDPGQTPVDGNFTFDHADLSTFHGVQGTLSSAGRLAGTLSQIQVHGSVDTPNFALDLSAHPFAVHAEYQALVDGLSSAVALQAVTAHFLRTTVECNGTITRATGVKGHRIALDIRVKQGRSEDILVLFNKSSPPLVSSSAVLEGHFEVPPGPRPLVLRMIVNGKASLTGATWSNPATQQTVDAMSLRAQDVHLAKQAIEHPAESPLVTSTMSGTYLIRDGNIDISKLLYKMPGATVLMQGRYPLTDQQVDFHGVARTVASATRMESGWKSLLLKPVSPLLHKNAAGMQIPVSFTGNKQHPVFAVDVTHPFDDKPGAPPSLAP